MRRVLWSVNIVTGSTEAMIEGSS